jgi:hypothetical protein
MKGGTLKKVALLGCLLLQVLSDVTLKARHLAAAAAVSVLEAPVLLIPAMMSPAMQASALEEMTQHGVVSELEAQMAAPQVTKALASVAPVSLATATSCKGQMRVVFVSSQ